MKRPPWYTEGESPDYRFSLANERTYLAWIRTALALLAAGILLDQVATGYPPIVVSLVALLFIVFSAACTVAAYLKWRANEIAMRHKAPLPYGSQLLSIGFFFVAVAVLAGAVILG